MKIYDVGRICLKIAGRDANKYCVIINTIDSNFVEIDGQTRRRKCNIDHLEPLNKIADIKKNASNKDVVKALTSAGFITSEKKSTTKKIEKRPRRKKEIVTTIMGKEIKKDEKTK
jgi:large subunit ribosomal protein L14e